MTPSHLAFAFSIHFNEHKPRFLEVLDLTDYKLSLMLSVHKLNGSGAFCGCCKEAISMRAGHELNCN